MDSATKDIALELRKLMPQFMPRKVIKQTVMTTVYGVTNFGAIQQIRRQLKALNMPIEKVKFSLFFIL